MASMQTVGQQGVLQVVPPAALEAAIRTQDRQRAAVQDAILAPETETQLAGFIRSQFETFSNHRNTHDSGWSERLLDAMRTFRGEYHPSKLADIKKFGGSEIYARIVAMKCRGASSLLRDIYLAPDRPWAIQAPADPDVPAEIVAKIQQLVTAEVQKMGSAGVGVDVGAIRDRVEQLMDGARQAERKQAEKRAKRAEDQIEEILDSGGFYTAIAEFITDLPLFPFACIKGPTVRIIPNVRYVQGQAVTEQTPKLFWQRISPFDLWWTPGVTDIENASTIERFRVTRAELNDLLDLPGYNHDALLKILEEHGKGGLTDHYDSTDSERATFENRENPHFNRSGLISGLEFNGNIQGSMLLDYGMGEALIPDAQRDYMVQAWLIGRYVIKCQLSPSPRKRHPYYVTSFEKVPGTPVGNGLPDILGDIQEAANATLRSLVNNMSIASGPQVVVNDDRLSPNEDGEELYPWKRWHVQSDPMSNNTQMPISFFMPTSNTQELLAAYKEFSVMADDISAIPKYMSGAGPGGGAGRTASGLAMLMGNASKILQTVAGNIDRDIFEGCLNSLYDMLMLTDTTGMLRGDENIRVMGVNVAVQRETQRSRQLEFLQITANPVDMGIIGPKGRASVLRSVSGTIGLDGDKIVPSEQQLEAMEQQQAQQMAMQQAAGQAQGDQKSSAATNDMGPRTSIAGGAG